MWYDLFSHGSCWNHSLMWYLHCKTTGYYGDVHAMPILCPCDSNIVFMWYPFVVSPGSVSMTARPIAGHPCCRLWVLKVPDELKLTLLYIYRGDARCAIGNYNAHVEWAKENYKLHLGRWFKVSWGEWSHSLVLKLKAWCCDYLQSMCYPEIETGDPRTCTIFIPAWGSNRVYLSFSHDQNNSDLSGLMYWGRGSQTFSAATLDQLILP